MGDPSPSALRQPGADDARAGAGLSGGVEGIRAAAPLEPAEPVDVPVAVDAERAVREETDGPGGPEALYGPRAGGGDGVRRLRPGPLVDQEGRDPLRGVPADARGAEGGAGVP